MNLFAIADLHLSFGVENKSMSVFGPQWRDHAEKISSHWRRAIQDDDVILIAGDISWAMHLDDALTDLEWIDRLPGKKILSKGNHDYWWPSNEKLSKIPFSSLSFVNKSAIDIGQLSICGTRLWDSKNVDFSDSIEWDSNRPPPRAYSPQDEKIYSTELSRLEQSLKCLTQTHFKIALVHYPPIGPKLEKTPVSDLLKSYGVNLCIFGHLHNLKPELSHFDHTIDGIRYVLSSSDALNFKPLLLQTFKS